MILGVCHPFSASQSISNMWSLVVAPNFSVSFSCFDFAEEVYSTVSFEDWQWSQRDGGENEADNARERAAQQHGT